MMKKHLFFVVRKGSLIVDYEIQTPKTSQSIIQMTALSKNMVSGKLKVTYEGQEVTVSSVTLKDTAGVSSKILKISYQNFRLQRLKYFFMLDFFKFEEKMGCQSL